MDPHYGRAKAGRPARTYTQQLCEVTGCSPEDLLKMMNDTEKWRERVRNIRASGTTWWWWWWWWKPFIILYDISLSTCLYLTRKPQFSLHIVKSRSLIFHHHHHVVPLARISMTLSRHFSLSFIASGRFSGLHSVSLQSCCMCVRVGCPAFARPYVEVHRSTSPLSWSLLLSYSPQQKEIIQ